MSGRYPALEKGPLAALLGGEELLAQLTPEKAQGGKFMVLVSVCLW